MGIQNRVFEITIFSMTLKKSYMLIYSSFQRTGYFVFLRQFPFIKALSENVPHNGFDPFTCSNKTVIQLACIHLTIWQTT